MKLLIIGGTGLLSNEIAKQAIDLGHDVSILNRGHHKPCSDKIHVYLGDLHDMSSLKTCFPQKEICFDVIIDVVSYTPNTLTSSLDFFKSRCEQYIFFSTACVFGRKDNKPLIETSEKNNTKWQYAIDKQKCEELLIHQAKVYGLKYTIIRPYVTYGANRIPLGLMPKAGYHGTLIMRILNDKPTFSWENGCKCTVTHLRDFAHAVCCLMGNKAAYNEDFNIVGSTVTTWHDILLTIYNILGKQENIIQLPVKQIARSLPQFYDELLGDRCLNTVFDNYKLKRVVPSFSDTISLEDGLKEVVDNYKKYSYYQGIDFQWDAQVDRMLSQHDRTFFMDYLSSAQTRDKINYYRYRYLGNLENRIIDKSIRILS